MSRVSRALDRILKRPSSGARTLAELLGDDVVQSDDLLDLLGEHAVEFDGELGLSERVPRIRPVLVTLAARASGAQGVVDADLQRAAELLHAAVVLHDVALGRGGGRRRRVAKKVVRRSVGWIGGNHLTVRTLELVRHVPNPEILGELVDTLREIADGQALVQELQREPGMPTTEDWLDHADAHTGALFAFCCRAGGHLGDASPATVSALGRYGRHLGRLWNVAEDVEHLQGDEAAAHLLKRAMAGRPVMPVALAAERDDAVGQIWENLVRHPDAALAAELSARVLRVGGDGASREAMARESWAARRALRTLDETPYRRGLDHLAAGLIH
jgi:geranylgeranyl pyrophosphate synthase